MNPFPSDKRRSPDSTAPATDPQEQHPKKPEKLFPDHLKPPPPPPLLSSVSPRFPSLSTRPDRPPPPTTTPSLLSAAAHLIPVAHRRSDRTLPQSPPLRTVPDLSPGKSFSRSSSCKDDGGSNYQDDSVTDFEEAVSLESAGECFINNFKCPCGKV